MCTMGEKMGKQYDVKKTIDYIKHKLKVILYKSFLILNGEWYFYTVLSYYFLLYL